MNKKLIEKLIDIKKRKILALQGMYAEMNLHPEKIKPEFNFENEKYYENYVLLAKCEQEETILKIQSEIESLEKSLVEQKK